MATRLVYGASGGKRRNGFIIAAFLGVMGVIATLQSDGPEGDDGLIGGALILLGAAFAAWVWWSSRPSRSLLIMEPEGLWFRDWGDVQIPWEQIVEVYARGGRLRRFLCLKLREPDALVAQLPLPSRKSFTTSPLVKLPLLLIPYGAVDASPQELAAEIEAFRNHARMSPS